MKSYLSAAWKLKAGAFLLAILFAPPVAGQAPTNTSSSRQSIELMVGQGRLLQLDEAAESVYIGDTTIADLRVVAPDVVYIYGRKIGSTNLIAISAEHKMRANVAFRVVADSGSANSAARDLQPTTHTKLRLFGNRVAASGRTGSVEEALDVQNTAETFSPPDQPPINNSTIGGSQQINIRVRFAEVSRDDVQRLGIGSSGGGGIAFGGSGSEVDALVGAMQRNGMMTILAEPNLTASSGRTASFLAGGEIPIPTPGNQAGQITVTYKPFGVSLEFTPTLIQNESNRAAGETGSEFAVAGRGRQGQRRRPPEPDGPAGRYDGGGCERPDVCDRWFVSATDVVGFRQKPRNCGPSDSRRIVSLCPIPSRRDRTRNSHHANACQTRARPRPRYPPRQARATAAARTGSRQSQAATRAKFRLCVQMIDRGCTMLRMSAVYLCLAVAASALAGCAAAPPYPDPTVYWGTFPQQPPDYSPDYASVPVVDQRGRTRYVLVPRACLTPDATEPPFLGPHLPPGLRQRTQPSAHGRAPVRPGSRPPARRRSRGSVGPSGAGIHLWHQGHPGRRRSPADQSSAGRRD